MKNTIFFMMLLVAVVSSSAQDAKHNVDFKGYLTFITPNDPSGNTAFYGLAKYQIGSPAFAISILRGKGNYHQVELCDLALSADEPYEFGKASKLSFGFRYSYNISLIKTQNGKLKTFIGLGTHLLTNYQSIRYGDLPDDPSRYTTITGELNVTPVVSYSLSRHFLIEANFPLTLFGFTEEMYPFDNDGPWNQDNPYLGPQYFYARLGVAFNL